jgi:hypothetical protein
MAGVEEVHFLAASSNSPLGPVRRGGQGGGSRRWWRAVTNRRCWRRSGNWSGRYGSIKQGAGPRYGCNQARCLEASHPQDVARCLRP